MVALVLPAVPVNDGVVALVLPVPAAPVVPLKLCVCETSIFIKVICRSWLCPPPYPSSISLTLIFPLAMEPKISVPPNITVPDEFLFISPVFPLKLCVCEGPVCVCLPTVPLGVKECVWLPTVPLGVKLWLWLETLPLGVKLWLCEGILLTVNVTVAAPPVAPLE